MMRILSRLLVSILILCQGCHSTDKNENSFFHLHGKISADEGTKVYLKSQEFKEIITIDSTRVAADEFFFKGSINRPVIYGIYIEDKPGVVGIFMENDSISVQINAKDLSKSTVTGSKTNDAYHKFLKQSFFISSKIDQLFPLFQKARSEDNIEKLKNIHDQMTAIHQESTNFALNYARDHPNSYIAAYALHSVLNTNHVELDTIKAIYNRFSSSVKMGDLSLQIQYFITEREPLP